MNRRLEYAVFCGVFPLLVGCLIYTTWYFIRRPWLTLAGLVTMVIGVVLFVIGATCLLLYLNEKSKEAGIRFTQILVPGILVGGLLFSNFPIACLLMNSAGDIMTRFTVRIENQSGSPIDSFVLTAPGVNEDLGPIPNGATVHRHLHFNADGQLVFRAKQRQQEFGGLVEGYVTRGWAGDRTIIIKPSGVYEIRRDDR